MKFVRVNVKLSSGVFRFRAQFFRQPSGIIFTPSSLVYASSPPVKIMSRSGSLSFTCSSFLLNSLISLLISSRCEAPLSMSLLPSLHSIRAYLPLFWCRTMSASSPYRSW